MTAIKQEEEQQLKWDMKNVDEDQMLGLCMEEELVGTLFLNHSVDAWRTISLL